MTFPLNFNNNIGMFSGLMPTSFGSTSQPDTLSIFPAQIANQYSPIDTFCTNMWMNQAQLEKQYFALLMSILSDPNINHTPEPFVFDNFRPYDYNSFGSNGDKISQLNPVMQQKTMQLLEFAKARGLKVTITSGYRTKAEQAKLYATNPNAAKNSLHCSGKAIDIKIANGTDADYKLLGDYAKSIGMRWGGDFKNPGKERWHFDLGWS